MSDRTEASTLTRTTAPAEDGAGGGFLAPLRTSAEGVPEGSLRRRLLAAALLGAGPVISVATAAAATSPATAPASAAVPILTVSGNIRVGGARGPVTFDREALRALGTAVITTRTPWYDGPVRFEGVLMARLLAAVGATGTTVTAVALNDYAMDIPMTDFARFGVLLATTRNGLPMRVSERGPLFIVYPYDSDPVLRSSVYYGRSVWSVAQLVVR